MMTLTTGQAFSQFLEDITATEYQKTNFIPNRKGTVDKDMSAAFPATSDMPFSRGILMGSASKGTIIRPLDDIDVLAVFSNEKQVWQDKYSQDSHAFIYRIREAYAGTKIQQVGTRGQAVRVFYQSGGHVDVAPVFDRGDNVYHLPDGSGGWILTAPTTANAWYSNRNKELGYNLSAVVRLLKAWNRAHSSRFRSFHLETVAATVFSRLGSNYRNALQMFFEFAPKWLYVNDPGGLSGDLSSYLTPTARQALVEALNSAADRAARANEAEARGDHAEAKRLWQIILGSSFPS
ncbi:hypothetical protein M2152_000944 [Microbacteriaceae bacterium SG_E_30_P1]|uniref:Nucleotidyltransferase n=1 Tax=Antiquaquibacter oligotrophicus TaxID=2880260 RepID=A0ABT6KNV0_9MICO|nr:hypothetical protein [Antiquaquibacter oligotrophicus]MDH6180762.1 hypothetical protein [Antiquaquibacter oligotrophicus]UDF13517.1 hypothetical protein LH407_01270 [Antiquaquibacter oligotrophicus]